MKSNKGSNFLWQIAIITGLAFTFIPATVSGAVNNTGNTFVAVNSTTIKVNTAYAAPTVSSVSVPAAGNYGIGSTLVFVVHFSEAVNVSTTGGTPRLALTVGSSTLYANYASGTRSADITFRYTVSQNDLDTDGITVDLLDTNGGAIKNAGGEDGALTLNNVGSTTGVKVDGVRPTVVLSYIDSPYVNHSSITFKIVFSEKIIAGSFIGGISVTNATLISATTSDGGLTYFFDIKATAEGAVSFMLNAGGVTDPAGNTNAASSNTLNYVYDLTAPVINSVSVPANGTYGTGQNLDFTVNYNENVVVSTTGGTPYIDLTLNSGAVRASYVSGSGTSALTFRYTTVNGNNDNDGLVLGASVVNNGGTIKDRATNNAPIALQNVGSLAGVLVDAVVPTVSLTPISATLVNGNITLGATFSRAVSGFLLSDISVTNGTVVSLSTSNNISYYIAIQPTADGDVTVNIPAGVAQDVATNGNTASNTLTFTYDGTNPNAPVITGLTSGSSPTRSTTNTLKGTSEVKSTVDIYKDGIAVGTVAATDGTWTFDTGTLTEGTYGFSATATDSAHNTGAFSTTYNLIIDLTSPTITSVSVPANKTYKAGEVLSFTVYFSEPVIITGSPSLSILVGVLRHATLQSSTSTTATFSYTVQTGDMEATGIGVNTILSLNGGTIRDLAGNNAGLALSNIGATSGVKVDAVAPTVTLVPISSTLANGDITIKVNFSEAVTGFSASDVSVSNGTVTGITTSDNTTFTITVWPTIDGDVTINVPASVAQDVATNDNTASNTLTFTYDGTNPNSPVITGLTSGSSPTNSTTNTLKGTSEVKSTVDLYQDGIPVGTATATNGTWTFNTGTLAEGTYGFSATTTDSAGNTGAFSLTYNLIIDLTAPTITSISVPANKTYKAGAILSFTTNFSEPVTITGSPSLDLVIGSNTRTATLQSSTGTTATFGYTIVTDEEDTDGIEVGASLSLNGGTIKDAAGNDANLTLNAVGSTTNVKVDAVVPTVTIAPVSPALVNGAITITATFSEAVTGLVAGDASVSNGTVTSLTTSDHITYNITVTPTADGEVTVTIPSGAAQDIGGNDNTASGTLTFTFDGTAPNAPTITGLTSGSTPISSATNTLKGTAEVKSIVSIYKDGALLATAIATDGTWTFGTGTLTDGTYAYTATATDTAGNVSLLSTAYDLTIDLTAPTITAVSVPVSKTYKGGEVLSFTVTFSEPITITGAPVFNIVVGTTTRTATLQSSTGTTATFSYTVQTGEVDVDGIDLPAALTLNGATIKDAAGNDAVLTLQNAGSTTAVHVDAVAPVIDLDQAFSVVEHDPAGTSLGTVTGHDPAGGGTLQSWSIGGDDASGAGVAAFAINAVTGEITVKNTAVLDQHVNETITLYVTVSDGVNTSNTTDVKIKIKPKFLPPTDITLSNNTVNERSTLHTLVGSFTTTTLQPAVTFTYALVTGAGDDDNAAFTISNAQLLTNTTLDFATQPTYHVRIKVTDSNGLSFEKAFTVTVNFVNQAPVINTITTAPVCATTTAQTIAVTGISPVEAGQTYTLAVSSDKAYFDALTIADNGDGTATINYTEKENVSGTANITITVKDDGGTANGGIDTKTTSFALTISAPPVITIISDAGLSISKGDIIHLTANADNATTFAWTGTAGIESGADQQTATVRPLANATFDVLVTNDKGCTNTASVSLTVSLEAKQNAPNILTPNGDGHNDKWIVENIDLFPNNEVKIFDRAGRLVYTKKGYTNDWMGTVNGEALAEGTYYYIIDYGNGKIAKGYITILRDKY